MEREEFIKRLVELRMKKGVSARDMSLSKDFILFIFSFLVNVLIILILLKAEKVYLL